METLALPESHPISRRVMRWESTHHYELDGPFHASLLKLSDCWGLFIEHQIELRLSATRFFFARREKLDRSTARHVTAEHMREYEEDVRWLWDKLPQLSLLPETAKHELKPYLELAEQQLQEAKRISLFHDRATAMIVDHLQSLYLGIRESSRREELMASQARKLRDACFEQETNFKLVEAYFEATAVHRRFVDPSDPFLSKLEHQEAQVYSQVLLG